MPYYWRIKKGLTLIKLSLLEFVFLFKEEISLKISNFLVNIGLKKTRVEKQVCKFIKISSSKDKPIIFASACVDSSVTGGWKYNGGIKELNYLIKLVRSHGYEAYIVTYDGKYEPWLVEHQPTISIEEFNKKKRKNKNIRCITSWADARAFINNSSSIYFWDMELAYSDNQFFPLMDNLYRKKIKKVAGISRTIQAWHMANFKKYCYIIPNIIDESVWFPKENLRKHFNVGYMNEGSHTQEYLEIIKKITKKNGLNLNFCLIKGSEEEVLNLMRTCEVYISLNIGKDLLWGEGCPRTIIESISAGCVSASFDIIGNREIVHDGFNGLIVPRYCPDFMGKVLVDLYTNKEKIDRIRCNSELILRSCHLFESRWLVVKDFLDLDD